MSVHDTLLQRAAAVQNRNAVAVQFQPGDGSALDLTAEVSPEETRLVELETGGREAMRVRTVKYLVAEVAAVVPQRDAFIVGGEVWTVNSYAAGAVHGFAEVVRPIRVEKAGRGRLNR
jgi:hypothetical protein